MTVVTRADLVRIVDEATFGLTPGTRARLIAVALATPAVAVGWWHRDGAACPARQARIRNQEFQERFDRAMARHCGFDPGDEFRADVEDG